MLELMLEERNNQGDWLQMLELMFEGRNKHGYRLGLNLLVHNVLEVTDMAPKDWSNSVTLTAAELRNLLGRHAKWLT